MFVPISWCHFVVLQMCLTLVFSLNQSNQDLLLANRVEALEKILANQELSTNKWLQSNHLDIILKLEGRLSDLEKKAMDQEHTIAELKSYKDRFHNLERVVAKLQNKSQRCQCDHCIPRQNLKINESKVTNDVPWQRNTTNSPDFQNVLGQQHLNVQRRTLKAKKISQGGKIDKKRLLLSTPSIKPNQIVAFHAYISKHTNEITGDHTLIFDVVKTNEGNSYHPATGVFNVPVTGVYVFTWTIRLSLNSRHSTQLMKNTEEVDVIHLSTGGVSTSEVTGVVVIATNEGDDIFVKTLNQFNAGAIESDYGGRSSFSGWKLA